MIVVMNINTTQQDIEAVIERIAELGARPHVSMGAERTVIGAIGSDRGIDPEQLQQLSGVEKVVRIMKPYKLASRELQQVDTVIAVNESTLIGGAHIAVMAGPCSIESREGLLEIARELREMGVTILRGGAFKPRSSPYSFQGMGAEGLQIMQEVAAELGMATVTEVMAPEEVELVARYADILQIGTRNMQNYRLLEAVGCSERPVLLKRGMSATIEEFLLAAEYIMANGNPNVMLCERGIRSFDSSTRGCFDLNAIPLLKQLTHLPVIADPSHATGRSDLVPAVTLGAIAGGADGLIIEAHQTPESASSDGAQSLRPAELEDLIGRAEKVAIAVGRGLAVDRPRTATFQLALEAS